MDHMVVAPLGKPSHVDTLLAERGQARKIRCIVPYFASALHLVAVTNYVLTVSESAARSVADTLRLRVVEPPLSLASYAVSLLWHPRLDNEPANRWLREVFVRAAGTVSAGRASARPSRSAQSR